VISNQATHPGHDPWTGTIPVERMRWFTGRFVTARDLTDEQRYLIRRRWLLNRLLHGEGVLCGLDVRRDQREECASTTVWIEPGIALDCRGRELISDCRLCVTWPSAAEPGCEPPEHEERLLVIRYCEELIDPQYALLDDCEHPGKPGKEASRIREYVTWKLASREELPDCWPREHPLIHNDCADERGDHDNHDNHDEHGEHGNDDEQGNHDEHGEHRDRDGERHHEDRRCGPGNCLEPACRCDGWIPLAVLTRRAGGPIHVSDPLSGRLPAAGYLTKIARVNWPHGGELELEELIERRGRLEVDFDRPLLAVEGDATGINQFTFRVEFGGLERALEFLPTAEDSPRLEDRTRAVFTIDHGLWDPDNSAHQRRDRRGQFRSSLRGSFIVVTLLCDFILDCHGNPVDGDHLRGRLPSGNGTPGGVFRSWFAVS
jgi:hypothetical protein